MKPLDSGTITFVAGIISCVIGVSTFVMGRLDKSRQSGILEEKINQALKGITEIKDDIKNQNKAQAELGLIAKSHDEKIRTLFNRVDDLHTEINSKIQLQEVLSELLHYLQSSGNRRGNDG